MISTQPYKGTRDFYPEDMRVRNYIFGKLKKVLTHFGYQEYDGPMLESFELYAAKTSEEIVNEQLYWMIDRGERKLAIRPEMTPTLARMVAAKQNELPKPIRWFSIPNLWRYERPQRGRLREHWQLNVDVFGGVAAAEELEVCQIIISLMDAFGAKQGGAKKFEVRLNHRGLTDHIFKNILKLTEDKIQPVSRLLDAAGKLGPDAFRVALEKEALPTASIDFLISLLAPDAAQNLENVLASVPAFQELQTLLKSLTALGLDSFFRYDPSIMRGFLYYTGLVLEVYDLHPENNRALFGGGRYDNLVGMFGGKPLPGFGFGMGDVTFRNFLESHGLLPDFKKPEGIFIAHLGDAQALHAQVIAQQLRGQISELNLDIPVLTALETEKIKKIFNVAEKLRCRAIVLIGEEEVKVSRYKIKDLTTQTQKDAAAADLLGVYRSFN